MALMKRVSRLFTADLHAVLDRLEEPEAVLKQAVREMEEALARKAARLAALERERGAAAKRIAELGRARGELDARLDICFGADNDELARKLVRRKIVAGRLEQRLAARAADLAADIAAVREEIDAGRERLGLVQQKLELFAVDESATDGEPGGDADATVGEAEVEIALLEAKRARAPS